MKKLSYSFPSLSLMLAIAGLFIVASCTREELLEPQEELSPAFEIVGEPVDAYLSITVGGLDASLTTRAEEAEDTVDEDTDVEKQINDLWVFQYDASETATEDADKKLIMIPQYLTITNQSDLADLQVRLSNNNDNPSIIYVVTNTASSTWVKYDSSSESYDGFMTLADLKANNIPTAEPQMLTWDYETETYSGEGDISIPMAGFQTATVGEDELIKVNVERMYAKLCIQVDLRDFNTTDYNGALVYNVTISSIPAYSTVESLWSETDQTGPADYSKCSRWIERTFSSNTDKNAEYDDDVYPYVIYVPENIQGETEKKSETDKAQNIPAAVRTSSSTDALAVVVNIDAITKDGATMGPYAFYGYPGGNGINNFNVRRNCVYEVTMKIDNLNVEDLAVPSANCIVCLSNTDSDKTTTFFPYCRPEEGGGYKFSTYVDNTYSETSDGSKRIASVKIIWQSASVTGRTGGFLGDNSNGDYVKIDDAPTTGDDESKTKAEYVRKISVTVPAGEYGNALIAAYNSSDVIIWSWHIWSRPSDEDPSNVARGAIYYTYEWDSDGIKTDKALVPGYTVMPCNLGALADIPTNAQYSNFVSTLPTYGMSYQWGRKDPFLPVKNVSSNSTVKENVDYTNDIVGSYYDNENQLVQIDNTVTSEANAESQGVLFWSYTDNNTSDEDGFGINFSIQHPTVFMRGITANNYSWSYDDHDPCIWGGKNPDDVEKVYDWGATDALGREIRLTDSYDGTEKSIFDPCPYGWRVSPPDLWISFTSTGLNPSSVDNLNYDSTKSNTYGMTMYMDGWRTAASHTSYFPTQGLIIGTTGKAYRVGTCGNYLNAIADYSDRVNILHLHCDGTNFKIYETSQNYTIKSTGSAVRCVNTASVSSSTD